MNNLIKDTKSMLKIDIRRMFTMPLIYIMLLVSLVMPILILVMTSMMPETSIDPVTGVEKATITFTNTWQAIGSISDSSAMSMDLTSMCNINMLYFFIAIFVGIFIGQDFNSGFSKNLFTNKPNKKSYLISKCLVCFIAGALMLICFFIGSMIGGAIAGLSFDTLNFGVSGIIMSMLSKILLVGIFTSIFIVMSSVGKSIIWLSIIGSFLVGMLMFTMVPMISPLDSSILNVIMCLVGSLLFNVGLIYVGNIILKKTSLV